MDPEVFTEEWINNIDIDTLPDNMKPCVLWCRAYYTTLSQIKNMDIMLKYHTDQTNKAMFKVSQLEEKLKSHIDNNESLTRNLAYQHHNNDINNKRIKELENQLKQEVHRAEKAEACTNAWVKENDILNNSIRQLKSELKCASERESSIKAELKYEKERVNDYDSKNFQQELDLRRAEYRANEERKMHIDAENFNNARWNCR